MRSLSVWVAFATATSYALSMPSARPLLPLTARLMFGADTQHAATTAVGATGPATIGPSRRPRPATTRSAQETAVQPRNHGPALRITRAYRGNRTRRAGLRST
jgi:hypothetical protein